MSTQPREAGGRGDGERMEARVRKRGERWRWMEYSRVETKDREDHLMRWRDDEMADGGGGKSMMD